MLPEEEEEAKEALFCAVGPALATPEVASTLLLPLAVLGKSSVLSPRNT